MLDLDFFIVTIYILDRVRPAFGKGGVILYYCSYKSKI